LRSRLLILVIILLIVLFSYWVFKSYATTTDDTINSDQPESVNQIGEQLTQYFDGSRVLITFLMAMILFGFRGFAKFLQQLNALSVDWQDVPTILPSLGIDLIPVSIGFILVWFIKDRDKLPMLTAYIVFTLLFLLLIYLIFSSLLSFAIEQSKSERGLGIKWINNKGLRKIGIYDLFSVIFFISSSLIFAL